MKISVIVTIHNAEKYLRECLDSVLAQTFSDIEVLCMDGGSSDSSPQILRQYASMDNRIRIIDDPNTSYGHKINRGIREACGEYISVLESDDIYLPDMLEQLYRVVKQYDPDYVNADYLEFVEVSGQRYYSLVQMYKDEDYGYLQECRKHPEDMRRILRYWTGLFKKEFLVREGILMNESPGASFQDLSFRFLTSALANTCYHIREAFYLYRGDNPNSSVHDPKKSVATVDEYGFLRGELEKREIKNEYIWQHFYVWKYGDFFGNLIRFQGEGRESLYQRFRQELEREREVIEKNNYQKYSPAISLFLDKTDKEVREEVEHRYCMVRQNRMRQVLFYERIADLQIVIFGCGAIGRSLLKLLHLRRDKILCLTDNEKLLWGGEIDGIVIVSPKQATEKYPDALYIIANKLHADEITVQLHEMGIQETRIYKY